MFDSCLTLVCVLFCYVLFLGRMLCINNSLHSLTHSLMCAMYMYTTKVHVPCYIRVSAGFNSSHERSKSERGCPRSCTKTGEPTKTRERRKGKEGETAHGIYINVMISFTLFAVCIWERKYTPFKKIIHFPACFFLSLPTCMSSCKNNKLNKKGENFCSV
jgi:hypothetical protein